MNTISIIFEFPVHLPPGIYHLSQTLIIHDYALAFVQNCATTAAVPAHMDYWLSGLSVVPHYC